MKKDKKHWFVIVNPHAGSGKTVSEWSRARILMEQAGLDFDFYQTNCKGHAMSIAHDAAIAGERNFIAVGGDGTVHEVLDGLMHAACDLKVDASEFYLAVIPVGSGNDWIRTHNVPHDTLKVVELIAEGSFVPQDVVKVSLLDSCVTTYMANIGGVGFDARICERVNAEKDAGKSGNMLYVGALLYHLFHYKPSGMRIEADGKVIYDGSCYSIAFGTGLYSGGGMRQTPSAVIDDGLMDITVIPPLSIARIMWEAPKLFNGNILKVKELTVGKYKSVTVSPLDPSSPEIVEIDGENVGSLPVRLEVVPGQINVLHVR